jgi:hypothetical protein
MFENGGKERCFAQEGASIESKVQVNRTTGVRKVFGQAILRPACRKE